MKRIFSLQIHDEKTELLVVIQVEILVMIGTNPRSQLNGPQQSKKNLCWNYQERRQQNRKHH